MLIFCCLLYMLLNGPALKMCLLTCLSSLKGSLASNDSSWRERENIFYWRGDAWCMGKEQNMRTGNEFRNATRHILKAPHKSLKKWPLGRKLHECSLTISFYFDTLWKNMGFYYWCTSFIIWHTRVVKLVKNVFNEQKQIFLFFFFFPWKFFSRSENTKAFLAWNLIELHFLSS